MPAWNSIIIIITTVYDSVKMAYADITSGLTKHEILSGTPVQYFALITTASASIAPNPYSRLTRKPAPVCVQFPAFSLYGLEV